MNTYNVEIMETLSRVITIEAEDEEQAKAKATEQYNDGEVVLDSNDIVDTTIEVIEEIVTNEDGTTTTVGYEN